MTNANYPYPVLRRGLLSPTAQSQQNVDLVRAVGELRDGKVNSTGTVTLSAGATATIVESNFMDTGRVVLLQSIEPTAAALVVPTINKASGAFTLSHSAAAGTEVFDWVITG